MIKIGDCVTCIFPSKLGHGPDCIVGNTFIVMDITLENNQHGEYTGNNALVFSCHPYIEGNFLFQSASEYRFAKTFIEADKTFVIAKVLVPKEAANDRS